MTPHTAPPAGPPTGPTEPVRHRALWIAVGIACVLAAGTAAAAGITVAAVRRVEVVRVAVTEHGGDNISFDVTLPGALFEAGIVIAPQVMPDDARLEVREHLGEWGPLAVALLDDIARQPDFTLVEVDDRGDHVEVLKRGRHLVVKVRSDDADVDVQVPLSLVETAIDAFDV
jgi:hypothetical protein